MYKPAQSYPARIFLDPRLRGDDAFLGIFPVIPVKAGIQRLYAEIEQWYIVFLMRKPCVYILASKRNGTLYTGVTSNLVQRMEQHRIEAIEGFTKRYAVHRLVWCEEHDTMINAIAREKSIKKWHRAWKLRLIEEANPEWRDLAEELL